MGKKNLIQMMICIGMVCIIWGGFFLIKKYRVDRIFDVLSDDFSWVYQVDSVRMEEENLVIQGFAFEIEKNSEKGKFEIILKDMDTGKMYFPSIKYKEREDVNNYFLCEYDYLQSGFVAKIRAKKLDLEKKNYEVLLRVKGMQKAYRTGTYLSKGELMYADPTKYMALDVEGTDLKKIVEKGVLRVYRPDYGMYVYQYEGELYWIAEKDYDFDEQGDVIVQYQLDTTQKKNLPQHRLENGWLWDNLEFRFAECELYDFETEKYRVANMHLPVEYSVEKIWTGNYNEEWIWEQYFRPFYFFD